MITDRFLEIGNLALHCLDYDPGPTAELPFLYVPGISGVAEDGRFFFDAFPGRRCISLSMRGRGRSSAPTHGYSIAAHGADLNAAIRALGLQADKWHLHGYSIGVIYALAFLNITTTPPRSLILGDHAGRTGKLPSGWANNFSKLVVQGRSVLDNISSDALQAIERDSDETNYYESIVIKNSGLRALLLRGNSKQKPPSQVTDADEASFRQLFPTLMVKEFQDAGHFLRDTHRDCYLEAIGDFLRRHDDLQRSIVTMKHESRVDIEPVNLPC